MTDVATTLRTAYLAGPMRGIKEYNFPEFAKQAAWLRGNNWEVTSPAERDLAEGFDPVNDEAHPLRYYMQYDLALVCQADTLILLNGWESSTGARLEAVVAVEVGSPVFEITKHKNGRRRLQAVNPDYVREVFAFQGGRMDIEPMIVEVRG